MNILTASRLFTFVREGTMYKISTACFIYRSIFAVQALRKRRVQGHCAAYHFRIDFIAWRKVKLHKSRPHSIKLNFGYTMVCG